MTENKLALYMSDYQFNRKNCNKEGFLIEIDDFGSGYSSLNTLKDIKADVLKIDMEFLHETENEERGRVILNSIISVAAFEEKYLKTA